MHTPPRTMPTIEILREQDARGWTGKDRQTLPADRYRLAALRNELERRNNPSLQGWLPCAPENAQPETPFIHWTEYEKELVR